MGKVKVTKEVAEAIERIKGSLMTVGTLIDAVDGEWKLQRRDTVVMQQLTKEEALSAIFYGYEVEETREQALLREFKSINGACTPKTEFGRSAIERRKGFLSALELLGISIEGVTN